MEKKTPTKAKGLQSLDKSYRGASQCAFAAWCCLYASAPINPSSSPLFDTVSFMSQPSPYGLLFICNGNHQQKI
jgi:hypothetical protein